MPTTYFPTNIPTFKATPAAAAKRRSIIVGAAVGVVVLFLLIRLFSGASDRQKDAFVAWNHDIVAVMYQTETPWASLSQTWSDLSAKKISPQQAYRLFKAAESELEKELASLKRVTVPGGFSRANRKKAGEIHALLVEGVSGRLRAVRDSIQVFENQNLSIEEAQKAIQGNITLAVEKVALAQKKTDELSRALGFKPEAAKAADAGSTPANVQSPAPVQASKEDFKTFFNLGWKYTNWALMQNIEDGDAMAFQKAYNNVTSVEGFIRDEVKTFGDPALEDLKNKMISVADEVQLRADLALKVLNGGGQGDKEAYIMATKNVRVKLEEVRKASDALLSKYGYPAGKEAVE